jgi:hypothetical protein
MPYAGFQGFNYSNQNTFANDYVRKHNPLILFNSVTNNATRLSLIKHFLLFGSDLTAQALPQWLLITPNMTNDGHDTTVTFAAEWSRAFLEPLFNNFYFMNNTLIVLTFDEDETYTEGNKVFTLLLGGAIPASLKGTTDGTFYNHYSMLSTVEVNWDLPSLGRWDCGANVLEIVANKTGYKNSAVDTTNLYFNTSYPGALSDTKFVPVWPVPDTESKCASDRGVLDSIVSTWGNSSGTHNYTNVYPYDTASGNNVGGSPVVAAFASSSSPSSSSSSTPSSAGSRTSQTSPALSTGAKIGIGIIVPLVIILSINLAFILIHRRRQRSSQLSHSNRDALEAHDGLNEHKAELPGNKPSKRGGERYSGRAELDTTVTQVRPMAQLEDDAPMPLRTGQHGDHSELEDIATERPFLGGHVTSIRPAELDTIPSLQENSQSDIAPKSLLSNQVPPNQALTDSEPLPAVSQLIPAVTETEEEEEEELQYRERRLRERKELVAEKERLALEEDELRKLKAKAKGGASRSD